MRLRIRKKEKYKPLLVNPQMDIAIFQKTVFSSSPSVDALVPVKEFLSVSQHSNDFLKVVRECADASRDGIHTPPPFPPLHVCKQLLIQTVAH